MHRIEWEVIIIFHNNNQQTKSITPTYKKSKLAKHAYGEGHRVIWYEARILEIEGNSRCGKYK
jgi:hypothetical protein